MGTNEDDAAHLKELPGRQIDDVPFTGLAERLAQITAVATVLDELADELDAKTSREILGTITQATEEAVIFAGIKPEEWRVIMEYTSRGLKLDRETLN